MKRLLAFSCLFTLSCWAYVTDVEGIISGRFGDGNLRRFQENRVHKHGRELLHPGRSR
jgi:hypothetical protein